jgi:hypothetical protein
MLIEHGTWFTVHSLDPGETRWYHTNEEGDYTGEIGIECIECHKKWHYKRNQKKPKWVEKIVDEALDEDNENELFSWDKKRREYWSGTNPD